MSDIANTTTKITSSELLQIIDFLEEHHAPIQNILIDLIKSRYNVAKSYLEDWNFLKVHADKLCNHDNFSGPCIVDGKNLEEIRNRIWPNSGNDIVSIFDEKNPDHFWPVSHFCDYIYIDDLNIDKHKGVCYYCWSHCLFSCNNEHKENGTMCGISALKRERNQGVEASLSSAEIIEVFEKYVVLCEKILFFNECDVDDVIIND